MVEGVFQRPARGGGGSRTFYGWAVVGVITLVALASSVQINPTLGLFVKPLSEEFGWSRSTQAGAVGIGTMVGGLMAPFVGVVIDRFGARWVLFVGFLVVGVIQVAWGSIDQLWQFFAVIIIGRAMLQGNFNLTANVVIARWFRRQRARAMAVPNLGRRFGGALVPVLAQAMISRWGWRVATVSLGVFAWALTLLPILLWLRRRPEDLGLLPDGDPAPGPGDAERPRAPGTPASPGSQAPEVSFTLREAFRARSFYILVAAFSLTTVTNTGVTFNMLPLLTDRGLRTAHAVSVVGAWSLVGIPATIASGFLAERLTLRYLAAAFFLSQAAGMALLTQVDGLGLGLLFALVHGWSFTTTFFLQGLLFADYFGPASLGVIRGFVTPFIMFSNAIGPLAAAFVFDTTGSYMPILVGYSALLVFISSLVLFAAPPRRPVPEVGGEAEGPR